MWSTAHWWVHITISPIALFHLKPPLPYGRYITTTSCVQNGHTFITGMRSTAHWLVHITISLIALFHLKSPLPYRKYITTTSCMQNGHTFLKGMWSTAHWWGHYHHSHLLCSSIWNLSFLIERVSIEEKKTAHSGTYRLTPQ